jgi:hypothetical protein
VSDNGGLHAIGCVEPKEDRRDVGLDGAFSEVQLIADLSVRQSVCEETENIPLTGREPRPHIPHLSIRDGVATPDVADEHRRYSR